MHCSLREPNRGPRSSRRRSHIPVAVSSFARNAIGPIRSLVDVKGTFWQVCEVAYEFDRRSGRSLLFESDTSVRRVRQYPDTWNELSDAELVLLVESI
jgi:hypothetical protein